MGSFSCLVIEYTRETYRNREDRLLQGLCLSGLSCLLYWRIKRSITQPASTDTDALGRKIWPLRWPLLRRQKPSRAQTQEIELSHKGTIVCFTSTRGVSTIKNPYDGCTAYLL